VEYARFKVDAQIGILFALAHFSEQEKPMSKSARDNRSRQLNQRDQTYWSSRGVPDATPSGISSGTATPPSSQSPASNPSSSTSQKP
jgi:hypothetical protein